MAEGTGLCEIHSAVAVLIATSRGEEKRNIDFQWIRDSIFFAKSDTCSLCPGEETARLSRFFGDPNAAEFYSWEFLARHLVSMRELAAEDPDAYGKEPENPNLSERVARVRDLLEGANESNIGADWFEGLKAELGGNCTFVLLRGVNLWAGINMFLEETFCTEEEALADLRLRGTSDINSIEIDDVYRIESLIREQ